MFHPDYTTKLTYKREAEGMRLSQIMLNASRVCNEKIMCNNHGKCYYQPLITANDVGKYLCSCDSNYMGKACGYRKFENTKLREVSFTTIKLITAQSGHKVTESNYFKIAQILRNWISINEGVNRDFIVLAVAKAEEIVGGCHWDVGTG